MAENRKSDHIALAMASQKKREEQLTYVNYEPLFAAHPQDHEILSIKFLGKDLNFPLWISSMTGGASKAFVINRNLAKMAHKFQIGMGLGSCRSLLSSDDFFNDFNLRPILGPNVPFYINLGIAQLEQLVSTNTLSKIQSLIDKLQADGLIIHVNPMQEWFQPEGDRFLKAPIETIYEVMKNRNFPIIVKEVGQGFGPKSLEALIELKVDAIELAGFGGTNFSTLETLRDPNHSDTYSSESLTKIGHSPFEMIEFLNKISLKNEHAKNVSVIISGGIQNVVEGQYYRNRLNYNSVIGQGMRFLKHAEDENKLEQFFKDEVQTLLMCTKFLDFNKELK
jgi:isopentenyl-diphosphate delta-isomerase